MRSARSRKVEKVEVENSKPLPVGVGRSPFKARSHALISLDNRNECRLGMKKEILESDNGHLA